MAPRHQKTLAKTQAPIDEDEAQSISAACEASGVSPDVAYRTITGWLMKRWQIEAGRRLPQQVNYDLNDSKLRGVIAALLPKIAAELSDLPSDVPFFDLEQSQVIDVFVVGLNLVREAVVSINENPNILDDEIPF